MSCVVRVVHLPSQTPYVRKIVSADFSILNGTSTEHGIVPVTVSCEWLLERRPLDWLDVVHLHHIEVEDLAMLERLLTACADASVAVVFTAHDIGPMHGSTADQVWARLELVAKSNASWIGLTAGSIEQLHGRIPQLRSVRLVPHGYVVPPDLLASRTRAASPGGALRYLMYGALRANRDHRSTIANWSLSIAEPVARLNLLLRPFNPADFERHDIPTLLTMIRSDRRITAAMRGYISDSDVLTAGLQADALLLPYLFGSHSGQLEFAFDLGLVPVCSAVGYFRDQYRMHDGLVEEPIWFEWNDSQPLLYGARFGEQFVTALEKAHQLLRRCASPGPNPHFLEYRRHEHGLFLAAHRAIYAS